jgi:transposase
MVAYAEPHVARDQIVLIPRSLDDLIPEDHPIRLLDELLDRLDWSVFNEEYRYEKRGRPPIDPKILTGAWIYAHLRKVHSSRNLEYQLNSNVEFMWLAHGHRIDHSTLANFRKRHKDALKEVQRNLISLAKDLGVIKIAELYVDGTRIRANANRYRTLTAEKAGKLLDFVRKEIDAYLEKTELNDQVEDLFEDEASGERLPEELRSLQQRKERLEQIIAQCEEADAARKKQGIDPEKNPFQLPLTDQDSRILPNKEGGYAPNYTPIVGVEGELGLIVSSIMINGVNEQDYLIGTVADVEESYGVTVETVGADAAFSIGPNITELEENRGIDFLSPHRNGDVSRDNPARREDPSQPVPESELDRLPINPSTKKFSTEAFVYDEEEDVYYCPRGHQLHRAHQETRTQSSGTKVKVTRYYADSCDGCPLLSRCREGTNHKRGRGVSRDEHETNRRKHREKMSKPDAKQRYAKRLSPGERCFGQIKHGFGIRRFQTRGMPSVESEFELIKMSHNLLRLTNEIGSIRNLRALSEKQPMAA